MSGRHAPMCGWIGAPDDPQQGCTCGGGYVRPDSPEVKIARATLSILHEALLAGGYSAGRIIERLREVGVTEASLSNMHEAGLRDVANAISDAAYYGARDPEAETADLLPEPP